MENKLSENKSWIKDLASQELNIEASHYSAFSTDINPSQNELAEHSLEFLKQLKTAFTAHFAVFNHIKSFSSSVKIYGIADTKADFMLFRKGHKLIFSLKEPGLITVRMKFNDHKLIPGTLAGESAVEEPADLIKGEWGAFNELKWTYNNQAINIDYLLKYYMTYFVKNSAR